MKKAEDTSQSNSTKTKICRLCEVEQDIEKFYKHPSTKDGLKNECKECYVKGRKDRLPKKQEGELFMRAAEWPLFRDSIMRTVRKEPDKWYMLWCLIASTGLRVGEALAIEVGDINATKPIMKVHTSKQKRKPIHETDVPPLLWGKLCELQSSTPKEQKRIFPWTTLGAWRCFKRVARRAKLNPSYGPHSLRHMYGSKVAAVTKGDLVAVQKALRHSSPRIAQRYVHLDEERRMEINKQVQEDVM